MSVFLSCSLSKLRLKPQIYQFHTGADGGAHHSTNTCPSSIQDTGRVKNGQCIWTLKVLMLKKAMMVQAYTRHFQNKHFREKRR